MIGFIPLIIFKITTNNTENAIKYFLIQAIASIIIILSSLIFYSKFNFNNSLVIRYFLTLSLGLKAGVAPLHYWFPQIIASLEWLQLIILSTWQKIAPLILMSFNFSFLLIMFIIFSAIIGAINTINQIIFKKLLAFSSIINSAWLITISLVNLYRWWVYFLIYSLITLTTIYSIVFVSLNHINIINFQKINYAYSIIIFINLISLGGLPPLTGFFIKIIVIDIITSSIFRRLIIITLLISRVISLYFYIRVMYNIIFQFKKKRIIKLFDSHFNQYSSSFISISLIFNLCMPLLITLS